MYTSDNFFTLDNCLLYMDALHKPAIYLRFTALVYYYFLCPLAQNRRLKMKLSAMSEIAHSLAHNYTPWHTQIHFLAQTNTLPGTHKHSLTLKHTPWRTQPHSLAHTNNYSLMKSVLIVISFPLIDNRWKRYCFSKGSRTIWLILLPNSEMNSDASEFHWHPFSMTIGIKWFVLVRLLYFANLLVATLFAAALFAAALFAVAPALSAVSPKWDVSYESGTVMSQAEAFHAFNEWVLLQRAYFRLIAWDRLVPWSLEFELSWQLSKLDH